MTCNPEWPEIKRHLLEGQTAFDRPDIVCRVFKHKLMKFLEALRLGKKAPGMNKPFFNGAKQVPVGRFKIYNRPVYLPLTYSQVYIVKVIEFQKRGLPHGINI